jgi:hypothetical protein
MITNTGKGILAKYLVGQAPAYASYIALGCGPKPLPEGYNFASPANASAVAAMQSRDSLEFEMFRVPITSRGYVVEEVTVDSVVQKISKIVLTAELPTEERYEISEVGIFSAGANSAAGAYDSKIVSSFSTTENWEYHSSNGAEKIPTIYVPLDSDNDNVITGNYKINPTTKQYDAGDAGVAVNTPAIQTSADNRIFTDPDRISRYENCRFLNNVIMIKGDTSTLSTEVVGDVTRLKVETGSNHIHLGGAVLDFNNNSGTDELRLAFSVINRDGADDAIVPDEVRIMVEFSNLDAHNTGEWARFEAILTAADYDFANNRYYVNVKQLQQLRKSTAFNWNEVDIIKIFGCVINNSVPSPDFYICLDALRLENVSTTNSLYGLSGYSIIKNSDAKTITKLSNTTNYVEFRFTVDVQ